MAERGTTAKSKKAGFSDAEREAMKERAKEIKAKSRAKKGKADGEADLRAKIAEMNASDRAMAKKIHTIVKATAPELEPSTWYGMPAWTRDGKVICFFTPAGKFKERFASFGFQESANLDDGTMWPTAFALLEVDAASEARIADLVKRAVS